MKTSKINLSLLVFLLFGLQTIAQQTSLEQVREKYKLKEYKKVISLAEELIENGADESVLAPYLATSYEKNNTYDRAIYWLEYLVEYELAENEHYLSLAQLKKSVGAHDEALKWFKHYNELEKENPLVARHLANQDYALDLNAEVFKVKLKNMKPVNSQYNDFCAVDYKGKVVFSSSRKDGADHVKKYKWDGENFLDLYQYDHKKQELVTFSKSINTAFHEGPICFTPDGKKAYFTRNNYLKGKKGKDAQGVIKLKLYEVEKIDGQWSEAKELPFNGEGFSTGHATISADGKTMVFVSDNPEGLGGSDLYVTTFGSYGWEKPVHAGVEVNTELNEMFPFLNEDGTLYFSSNGHLGLGGLDVFRCSGFLIGGRIVEHLGTPINSEQDDFGFYLKKGKGFISSNRAEGLGGDDIYSFTIINKEDDLKLTAQVRDAATGMPLIESTVEVWNNGTLLEKLTPDNSGGFIVHFTHEQCPLQLKVTNGENWSTYDAEITNCHPEQEDIALGEILLEKEENIYQANVNVSQNPVNQTYQNPSHLVSNAHVHSSYANQNTQRTNYQQTGCQNQYAQTGQNTVKVSGNMMAYGQNAPVGGLLITVTDKATGQTWQTESPYSGEVNLELNKNSTYEISTQKDGYSTVSTEINTGLERNINLNSAMADTKMIPLGTNNTIVLENIFYDTGKWLLREDATVELNKLIRTLKSNPTMVIELSSHTDSRGSAKDNLVLSEKRAMAAVRYIIDHGISPTRISGKGYGESRLINNCSDGVRCSEYEHQQNRRTEVKILRY